MTGWALFAVFAVVAGGGAFVAYWSGVGKAERRAAAELRRLRNALIDAAIREQVKAMNGTGPRLTAAEIDAWHELVCDLEDEAS